MRALGSATMPEQLIDRILGEIRERLDASRDAYEESLRLEAALVALGDAPPEPRSRPRAERRGTPARAARSASRAPRGENLRRVRDAVAERPGATAGEVASATGIARATVASTLGKLARSGDLERAELPSGRVGYRPASAADREQAPAETAPDTPSEPPEASADDAAGGEPGPA